MGEYYLDSGNLSGTSGGVMQAIVPAGKQERRQDCLRHLFALGSARLKAKNRFAFLHHIEAIARNRF